MIIEKIASTESAKRAIRSKMEERLGDKEIEIKGGVSEGNISQDTKVQGELKNEKVTEEVILKEVLESENISVEVNCKGDLEYGKITEKAILNEVLGNDNAIEEASIKEVLDNKKAVKGYKVGQGLENEKVSNEVRLKGKKVNKRAAKAIKDKGVLETENSKLNFNLRYKEIIDLIRGTGEIASISAHEVYEGDVFEYAYGLDERLIHIPCGSDEEDRITHFYSCYKLKDGGTGFIVRRKDQIDMLIKAKNMEGIVFEALKEDYLEIGLKIVVLKLINYMKMVIGGDIYGNL